MAKKTPIIHPLLVNNNLISNFRENASNIFNDFFVHQYQSVANNSILSTKRIFYIQKRLKDFDIDCGKILKLINGLYPHKAHGHDGIYIGMVQLTIT